ncbi:helix-turn-helix domain-containing protein [Nonomuraea roseoviolacea]|uniref:Helix-turn-helix domain-containing protein n=1 Tax=Nonomuraea roseoviolacea subsp. carminata TaxID=160689 RepID=A0ABT1K9I5_9ACTN|nr:helix-turn-helix domain-containing protein [Nonomuraea roseoviolacea]MCP2350678.1 hypothetical protein [Nonomuraea roseoviolacea subsp. carminata]
MKRAKTKTADTQFQLPLLLTIPQVCEQLGLDSRDAVYDRIRDGLLEAVDVAGEGSTRTLLRVPAAALLAYVANLPRVHNPTP